MTTARQKHGAGKRIGNRGRQQPRRQPRLRTAGPADPEDEAKDEAKDKAGDEAGDEAADEAADRAQDRAEDRGTGTDPGTGTAGEEAAAGGTGRAGGTGAEAGTRSEGDTGKRDTRAAAEAAGVPVVDLAPLYAFEQLYESQAEPLARQAFLLCGDRKRAEHAVAHAFRLAWERWPEVATDPDPPGWVRAAAYEYALSPWHRLRPRPRRPRALPAEPGDRTLLNAVLELPPSYRRCLVLHEGLGMSVADTAAEVEATTQAAAGRIAHARQHLTDRVPELTRAPAAERGRVLAESLDRIAGAQPLRPLSPRMARLHSERVTGRLLYACAGLFALLSTLLVLTALTGP
ncbi:RNA polymerase sigma factor [Streptomyces sp. YIM 98790]|uniref:RNA polymerase sigma factor n=1 Tax=Streptomyces sp. YIM 98790 TaxID=2689077 RepID=UPI001A9EC283|nr:sigma factor-like helix-turn-helix DNA-binding protein [Streptomyces sp. YIM 98790]